MSDIEAIIVDGVRYDKVKAQTVFVCEECELREVCNAKMVVYCWATLGKNECWKRCEQ